MDPAYQRQFKEVEITSRFATKLGGMEKSYQGNPIQPMVSWRWT